ncbi:MAG TPA: MraY family glycosyltransferase [Dissulfurispiraceae bacterium]|nr:MraY family glycosyltransferase [Dissulfurispiraceae bacterium]
MIKLADKYQMVDIPDVRKIHTIPVPRIGGLAMALGASVPVILWSAADDFLRAYFIGAGVLVLFGLVDDMKGLGHKAKFAGQIVAALVAVLYGGVRIVSLGSLLPDWMQLPEWFAAPLSLVAVVGVTNAINLADGLDGLAGGISLLSFWVIGYLAYLVGSDSVVLLSLALAGAIFGFLRFNTHPASLFMGDTGSQLLGFSAVVLAMKITQGDTPLSPVLPLIILGFPVLDTLTVMVERIREGRHIFSADMDHFHHRLIRLGLSQSEAVFAIYVIQSMMIVSAMLFRYQSEWLLLAGYFVFSVVIISGFAIADHNALRLRRSYKIENAVKGKLRTFRDNNWTIKISFSMSKLIIPLLFIFSCFLPARVPFYVAVMSSCFGLFIAGTFVFFRKKYLGGCLRLVLYLTIPIVLYLASEGMTAWMNDDLLLLYRSCFGIVALLMILTVRFTRRKKGFRVSTMDFLIIFIAIIVPNLTGQFVQSQNLGLLAVEIIVFFFGYEVLINEVREKFNVLAISTLAAVVVLGVRGFAGI